MTKTDKFVYLICAISIAACVFMVGRSSVSTNQPKEDKSVPITIVVLDPVAAQTSSTACVNIGPAATDATMRNMVEDGYDIDYRDGIWYFDQKPIGTARFEDESFEACGHPFDINVIRNYQEAQS